MLSASKFIGFGLAGIAALTAMAGCHQSKIARKPVIAVRGSIVVNGKPAAGAVVSFLLLNANPRELPSQARTGANGEFSLATYTTGDGVPKGEYVVTVYWPDSAKKLLNKDNEDDDSELPPDLLQGRFATRNKSVLRARVGDNPIEFAPVDLGSNEVAQAREYRLREKQ